MSGATENTGDLSLKGKLLVAMPSIGDDRFSRSVILVCAHEPDYAMGIVLNNPVPHVTVPDILEQLEVKTEIEVPNERVLDGGPVGNDRGFVLHSSDYHSEGSTLSVSEDCSLTATRDVLVALASSHPPERSTLALGYSGWGAGQLEYELRENAWLVGPATHDIVYGLDHEEKWDRAIELMGVDAGKLQHHPGRA